VNINGLKELDAVFTYHAPFGTQPERYVTIRNRAREFGEMLLSLCPASRERSLALTRLQECVQMANASIAINEQPVTPAEHTAAIQNLAEQIAPTEQKPRLHLAEEMTPQKAQP
jgi:hypothetical protein